MAPRIINKADEMIDLRKFGIASRINDEFDCHLSLTEVRPCHLGFDNYALAGEKKINPRCVGGVAWRPFLRADIIEVELQDRVEKVLNIVFIRNLERLSPALA
jgi:hypothetical protein